MDTSASQHLEVPLPDVASVLYANHGCLMLQTKMAAQIKDSRMAESVSANVSFIGRQKSPQLVVETLEDLPEGTTLELEALFIADAKGVTPP